MSLLSRTSTETHLPTVSSFSSSSSTATFTSQLRATLLQSRSIIDTWVVDEKKRVDQHVKGAKQELIAKQRVIDGTSAQLLALQLQNGCSIGNHDAQPPLSIEPSRSSNKLSEQQTELETKIQQQTKKNQFLDTQMAELKKQIKDLQIEEEKCKDRAFTAQQQAAMAATSKDTTVNDLTRGLVNYKYLGLDFQKADHDRLKFSFTQLDPANPNQEFSFCLGTQTPDDEIWSIFDCNPIQLSEETLAPLIEPLNRTNDMLSFVRNMRNEFLQSIPVNNPTK